MKTTLTNVLCIILSLIFYSCNNNLSKENLVLNDIISNYFSDIKNEKIVVVIIPMDGCSGCIKSMIEFANENVNLEHVYYVINSSSKKALKTQFSTQLLNSTFVNADNENRIFELPSVTTGSVVYFIKNFKITNILLPAKEQNKELLFNRIKNFQDKHEL